MDPTVDDQEPPDGPVSSRHRVLLALRRSRQARGVLELAGDVGLHPNTVRFHLDRLERHGLVRREVEHQNAPGRPPLRFTAAPAQEAGGERRDFQGLAQLLAGLLDERVPGASQLSEQAGRVWAQQLVEPRRRPAPDVTEALELLLSALTGVGFDPQIVSTGRETTVLQRRCPFLEVAREHRDVVCSVQLGLIRGLLERLGAPVEVVRLVPFAGPWGCLVHLRAG